MKLTKQTLKQIIKEEIEAVLVESLFDDDDFAERWAEYRRGPVDTPAEVNKAIQYYKESLGRRDEQSSFNALQQALYAKYSHEFRSGGRQKAEEEAEQIKTRIKAEEEQEKAEWEKSKNITPEEQKALQTYRSNYGRGNVMNATQELVRAVGEERAALLLSSKERYYDPKRFDGILDQKADF